MSDEMKTRLLVVDDEQSIRRRARKQRWRDWIPILRIYFSPT